VGSKMHNSTPSYQTQFYTYFAAVLEKGKKKKQKK
jgi:hypothetical protein